MRSSGIDYLAKSHNENGWEFIQDKTQRPTARFIYHLQNLINIESYGSGIDFGTVGIILNTDYFRLLWIIYVQPKIVYRS